MNEGQNLSNVEELEANESSYDDYTETEETTSESEQQHETEDSSGDDSVTNRLTAQRDRLKEEVNQLKAEKEDLKVSGKENHPQGSSKEGLASKEELDRFRLETKGIENKDQQDFVLKFAKLEGVSVAEALNDDIVKAKLEKLTAEAEKGRATQSPINRTGRPREKTPEELAKQAMTKEGAAPRTPEEAKAVLKAAQKSMGMQ